MFRKLASKCWTYGVTPFTDRLRFNSGASMQSVTQKALSLSYWQSYHREERRVRIEDTGFRVHSQHEEDGILHFIFSLIGSTNKECIEICAGNGIECNTANLIICHRWTGLLIDGCEDNIARAKRFYAAHPDTRFWPPKIVKEWITRANVNRIVEDNGFTGEIDLLSLDVDGVDYWLWEALTCVSPRVVVLEFNHLWGDEHSVTVPYHDDFVAEFTPYGSDYAGASLPAFVKLGNCKGYRLVGTNAIATNAFFLRNDIHCDWLPEISASSCFRHPRARFGMQHRLPAVEGKEWVEV